MKEFDNYVYHTLSLFKSLLMFLRCSLNVQAVTVNSFPTTEAGVAEFKSNYGAGVARFLNISSSAVNVISATAMSRRERGRVLLSVTVNVLYEVTLPQTKAKTVTAAEATASLTSLSSRAAFDESLAISGLSGAISAVPQLSNLSPTTAPTPSPVSSASTLRRDFLLFGVMLCSTCFMLS